jgi:carboxylesterase
MVSGLVLLIAIAAAVALTRAVFIARVERQLQSRRPVGVGGIIPGAEPFELRHEGAPAVLLLHGGGDTPQTLRYLGDHLHRKGYSVYAPLLTGHGRTMREFTRVSAEAWASESRAHYDTLRARHEWVGVVGLSMGGALAVQIAAALPTLPALVLLAPYIAMPSLIAAAARLAPLWGPLMPYVPAASPRSVHDPEEAERTLGYGFFSAAALHALYRTVRRATDALPAVRAPTLVIQSREDNRISIADAERAFALLGATEKRFEWTDGAGHVITVDFGRERVFDVVTEWLDSHRQATSRARPA